MDSIDAYQLFQKMSSKEDIILIDVREPWGMKGWKKQFRV